MLYGKASLQGRIILLVSLVLFAMLAALGISSYLAVQHSVQRALQERLSLAGMVANHLEYVVQQSLRRLEDLGRVEAESLMNGNADNLREALRDVYFQTIFNEGVFITDARGQVILVEPYSRKLKDSNLASYPQVRQALESGRPVVSDVMFRVPDNGGTGEEIERATVLAVRPLKNHDGRTVGLVGGEMDIMGSSLSQIVQAIHLGNTGYIDVVDSGGIVLASTRASQLLTSSDHNNILVDLIVRRRPAVSTCHSCHDGAPDAGNQRLTEVMAFAPLETIAWGVSLRQDEDEALEPARMLQRRFILFGVAFYVPALFLSWGLARSIVSPLKVLSNSAQRIAEGNLEDPIPPMGQDEIGQLSRNLDIMRAELRESIAKNLEWTRELESRVRTRTRELEESRAVRGELLHKFMSAQEEERKRIARELHDDTSQSLTTLVIGLDRAMAAPSHNPNEREERLKYTKSLAIKSLEGVHRMIFDLRPTMLDDLGLIDALRWYGEDRLKPPGMEVKVEISGEERRLPSQVETAVFRAAQEAITNIAKHARAKNVFIGVEFSATHLIVKIEDDGRGFDMAAFSDSKQTRGLGLMGMKERISLMGGSFNIVSLPGEGTRVYMKVPYGEEKANGKDQGVHS